MDHPCCREETMFPEFEPRLDKFPDLGFFDGFFLNLKTNARKLSPNSFSRIILLSSKPYTSERVWRRSLTLDVVHCRR